MAEAKWKWQDRDCGMETARAVMTWVSVLRTPYIGNSKAFGIVDTKMEITARQARTPGARSAKMGKWENWEKGGACLWRRRPADRQYTVDRDCWASENNKNDTRYNNSLEASHTLPITTAHVSET